MEAVIRRGTPLPPERLRSIIEAVRRDGFVHLPGALEVEEVEELRARVDRVFEEQAGTDYIHEGWAGVRLFEVDQLFRDMSVREPIIGIAEAVCGSTCRLVADSLMRNPNGVAVTNWHVDDTVYFPLPEGSPPHDPRLLPVVHLIVAIPLTDIPSVEYGPTQIVPGSHCSGREPDSDDANPLFEGRGAVSMISRRGDIYLHNNQVWHRGAPNESGRMRYLYQLIYGPAWVAQRFYTDINYAIPRHVLEGADEHLLRVLGKPIPGVGS
jgi:ectoine hydroxylase-related dioxygenase (phytanoyl-CoA dioxygenase family)